MKLSCQPLSHNQDKKAYKTDLKSFEVTRNCHVTSYLCNKGKVVYIFWPRLHMFYIWVYISLDIWLKSWYMLRLQNCLLKKWLLKPVLLTLILLPFYVILFVIWQQLCSIIKVLSVVENILKDDNFSADTVDAPKDGLEQHGKRECLKGVISKFKVLDDKKTLESWKDW